VNVFVSSRQPRVPLGSDARAARGTIQQLIARGCFMVSGFVVTVILTRGLGPAEYGVYGLIMSVLLWLEMGATAGVPGALSRLLPQYEKTQGAEFENTAFALLAAVSVGILAIGWVAAPFLAGLFKLPAGAATLFRIAFLDIPLYAQYIGYQGMLNGYRRYGTTGLCIIAYSLTKLAGILILWHVFGLTAAGALIVNVAATVGGFVYLTCVVPLQRVWPDPKLLKPILQAALPLGLILANRQVLLNLDLWSLKALGGAAAVVGLYIAAGQLPKMLLMVPNTIGNVLFSSLARALANRDRPLVRNYIQATTRFVLMALAPCCVILAQHAEPVMSLVFSRSFVAGAPFLRWQLLAALIQALFAIVLEVLGAAGHYALSIIVLLALVPFALVLNNVMIPEFGAIGAAGALVLTNLIGLVIVATFVHRRYGALIRPISAARIALATGVVYLLGRWIESDHPALMLLEFAALSVIYVLVLALLRELEWRDLRGFAVWRTS
jgi:O-antigen/teichoic acid export membrane protein